MLRQLQLGSSAPSLHARGGRLSEGGKRRRTAANGGRRRLVTHSPNPYWPPRAGAPAPCTLRLSAGPYRTADREFEAPAARTNRIYLQSTSPDPNSELARTGGRREDGGPCGARTRRPCAHAAIHSMKLGLGARLESRRPQGPAPSGDDGGRRPWRS